MIAAVDRVRKDLLSLLLLLLYDSGSGLMMDMYSKEEEDDDDCDILKDAGWNAESCPRFRSINEVVIDNFGTIMLETVTVLNWNVQSNYYYSYDA
jgi:hypothetical protein